MSYPKDLDFHCTYSDFEYYRGITCRRQERESIFGAVSEKILFVTDGRYAPLNEVSFYGQIAQPREPKTKGVDKTLVSKFKVKFSVLNLSRKFLEMCWGLLRLARWGNEFLSQLRVVYAGNCSNKLCPMPLTAPQM